MEELNLAPSDVVYLNGTFNDWCGSCTPMTQDGDVWEADLNLPPGQHQYLFTINGWDEVGNAPLGSECDYSPCDEYANYGLTISSGSDPIELATVCWGQCADCSALSTNTLYPERDNRKIVKILDLLGREVPKRPGEILIYLYDDGSAEKKMIWPTQ